MSRAVDVNPSGDDLAVTGLARRNRVVAWSCISTGVGVGLVMGLWSFDGPVSVPEWLGDYDDTSRRLARLGHIAFIGLGIINLLLARELPRFSLRPGLKRLGAVAMNFGNIFLPITLLVASVYHPMKHLMAIPALSVFLALVLAARGAWGEREVGSATDS